MFHGTPNPQHGMPPGVRAGYRSDGPNVTANDDLTPVRDNSDGVPGDLSHSGTVQSDYDLYPILGIYTFRVIWITGNISAALKLKYTKHNVLDCAVTEHMAFVNEESGVIATSAGGNVPHLPIRNLKEYIPWYFPRGRGPF